MEESSHFQGDIPKDLLCFWLTESEGNITNLCNHPTTHPNSVILATLVGKIRLLTPGCQIQDGPFCLRVYFSYF